MTSKYPSRVLVSLDKINILIKSFLKNQIAITLLTPCWLSFLSVVVEVDWKLFPRRERRLTFSFNYTITGLFHILPNELMIDLYLLLRKIESSLRLSYCPTPLFLNPHLRICLLIDERGMEGSVNQLTPICTLTRDPTCNPGMCPDWGSNPQLFGVWDNAPSNWATWPGLLLLF